MKRTDKYDETIRISPKTDYKTSKTIVRTTADMNHLISHQRIQNIFYECNIKIYIAQIIQNHVENRCMVIQVSGLQI